MKYKDYTNLKNIASQVRRDILRMVHHKNSGHPGGSLGCVEFFVSLYFEAMENSDTFFLSNGHLSPVWYSVLARKGFIPLDELNTFRCINSRLQGHPSCGFDIPTINISSGSLGQGLSVAIGNAISKKLNNDDSVVYTLLGDGELQEGQNWEAIMYASHNKIDNLIAFVDCNDQQIDGRVDEVLNLSDLKEKFRSFGWYVFEIMDGNNFKYVIDTFEFFKDERTNTHNKPVVILMNTEMGNGVDFMMGTNEWHGKAPNDEELVKALEQIEETIGDY